MTMKWMGAAGLLTAAAFLPSQASAQAVCSAPHSSPTLAQSGSISTMPAGAGWLQFSAVGSRATESYGPFGGKLGFAGDSEFDTRSGYVTGSVGIIQVPVPRLTVKGPAGTSRSNGVGDVRTALRISPILFGYEWPVALRAGLKLPGSNFPVDATELPLTEGQRDIDLSLESGWTSFDSPVYVVGWVGYRWRSENKGVEYEPGDELFAHAAVGGSAGSLHWELGVDALWGGDLVEQGVRLPSASRRLVQLLPTIGTELGFGTLEITAPIPITGRNLPVANGVSVGYRYAWGM
ncbi:MAG: transporter [Longimicrobiales bacterium]